MKSLKQLLEASLLDIDANLDITDEEAIRSAITDFINDNYDCKQFTISNKPNKDGKYLISSKYDVIVKNKNITSLTNDLFVFKNVYEFNCYNCRSLQSLEGAPKEVGGDFNCDYCNSLQSLEGAPEKVEGRFDCSNCNSLQSLEGAPKKVGGFFYCSNCKSLNSLNGAPKEVGWSFYCNNCKSLKSLEGAPKEVGDGFYCFDCKTLQSLKGASEKVGRTFDCSGCKVKFKKSDVEEVSDVKGRIITI